MARYRSKDEPDLVWNRTRRQITRDLDTRIANFREDLLNQLLTDAWTKFAKALETGTLIELEDHASRWIDQELGKHFALETTTSAPPPEPGPRKRLRRTRN